MLRTNKCQPPIRTRVYDVGGTSVSVIDRPAYDRQVTGDWYDAYELDEHRALLTVGDVMGHGPQASIIKARLCREIHFLAKSQSNPAAILDGAETALLRSFPAGIATAFVAILDFKDGQLLYANAGHPYPLLRLQNGVVIDLKAEGLPLGLRSIAKKADPAIQRLENVVLVAIYTDGLIEVAHDAATGEKRLREAVAGETILLKANPAKFLHDYCVEGATSDDVVVLVSSFNEGSKPRHSLKSTTRKCRNPTFADSRRPRPGNAEIAPPGLVF